MTSDAPRAEVAHRWRPIEDLPSGWQDLADADLHRLAAEWTGIRENPGSGAAIAEFSERLKREWAIETGLIERVYTLTRGITEVLIEHGLREELIPSSATDRDPALVFDMLQDHAAAVDGLFDFVRWERHLSTSYIKELHAVLLAHQESASGRDIFGRRVEMPLIRGDYKKRPNNPVRPDGLVHEYCPPEQVTPEMDRQLAMHLEHGERGVPPEQRSEADVRGRDQRGARRDSEGNMTHGADALRRSQAYSLTRMIREPSPLACNSIRPESTISPS